MLVENLLHLLLLLVGACKSYSVPESRLITIRKTIHKNESIIFNITEMFPGLIDDPWLEVYKPVTDTWVRASSNGTNFNLSDSIQSLHSNTIDNLRQCTGFDGFNNDSFVGFCSDRTELAYFKLCPLKKKFNVSIVLKVTGEERIWSSSFDHDLNHLYVLTEIYKSNFTVHAFEIRDTLFLRKSLRFYFETDGLGAPTIRIDPASNLDSRRLFVFITMESFKKVTIPNGIQFVTILYYKNNNTLALEGVFKSTPANNLPEPKDFRVEFERNLTSALKMSYLQILPHYSGVYVLGSANIEGVDYYQLLSCQLNSKFVKKNSCKLCTANCYNLTGFCGGPGPHRSGINTQCSFPVENFTFTGMFSKVIVNVSGNACKDYTGSKEYSECGWLAGDCRIAYRNCKECVTLVEQEPSFDCTSITNLSMMCDSADPIQQTELKQFYIMGSESVEELNKVYLLTNCQLSRYFFDKKTFEQSLASESFRFSKNFRVAKKLIRINSEIITFMKPFDCSTTYLAAYTGMTNTVRIKQLMDQPLQSTEYILLQDPEGVDRNYIVSYTYDQTTNRTTLEGYKYSSQLLSIHLQSDPHFVDGAQNISARLYGDCKDDKRIIYQFELTVLDTDAKTRRLAPVAANYWYYFGCQSPIRSKLPLDMTNLAANDPSFHLSTQAVEVESQRLAKTSNQLVFRRGNTSSNSLSMTGSNIDVLYNEPFHFLVYPNKSVSVIECRSPSVKSKVSPSLEDDIPKCSIILENYSPPDGVERVADHLVVEDRTGGHHVLILYKDAFYQYRIAHLRVLHEEIAPPIVYSLVTNQTLYMENVLMMYSKRRLITVIAIYSDKPKKPSKQTFHVGWLSLEDWDSEDREPDIDMIEHRDLDYQGSTMGIWRITDATYAITQIIDDTKTVVTWFKVLKPFHPYSISIYIVDVMILERDFFRIETIVDQSLVLFDKRTNRIVFQMRQGMKIKQLDTNVRPIYEGVLPVPGLDTNGDSIKDLVDIDVIQGIFIMGLNRSETDTANITKQFIDIYVVDMRGNDDDPIGRLRLKMTVEVPPYNGPLLVLQYLDPVTLRIHALICFEQGNIHVVGELHGSKATLKILPSKLGNGITERNMRYSGSACNESDSLLVPLKIVAAEWDDVIVAHATSNPYDLENNETSILEIESHLINIASHRAGYDVIAPESFKGTFEVIPMIVPDKRVSSLILPQPFQFKAEDKIFVHDDAHLLIRGKNSVTIFKIDSGRPPILLFNKTYSQNVLTAYMTYDPKMNYKVRGSGPLEFVFVLLKGDYDKNDVDMNVYDSTNFTSTAYYTDKDVGYCDCIRFEVIKRNQEIFSFSVHCRTKRGSGTTWTLSMVDLIPTNTDDKSITGTILGGFKPGDPYNGKPFQMKYKPLDGSGYGMMRPTSSSTLSYYFFDNMGQVGLMYFGNNKEVFGYHTFSTTCVLRQDTSISCRIFEQDMDLGCIVLCDQVRIESFKVRIRVDELDTENNEALTGVKVIKEEGYKIPINHKVLHLQKGETFDFVVTETSDKNQSVLMYDTATGLILYRMNASEICPKENPGCKLDSLYIHQFGDNRILLLPEGGQLDNSMFIWQKPQLNFSRDQLRKSGSLKEFKLVINSVTTKETNKMISILDLFKPKQEDFFWVYLAFVIVLAIFLVLCFLLLLYMNWRAEERAQVRKEDKEREKNSGLDRVNRMSKQDYKEVPSEKENNRTSLLPQPSVAADTNRTSLYKKKTIKL